MKYISTRGAAPVLSFEEAMLTGLARDGGLYLPQSIPHMSFAEIAKELGVSRQTVRTIQERALRKIAYKLEGYRGYERENFTIDWSDGDNGSPGDSR